jgi:membrane peptidoglycan carboxypeptidase
VSDQRDPRFDAPRGQPRNPYGGPPPGQFPGGPPGWGPPGPTPSGPHRRPGPPPPGPPPPERYRADGPPVASGNRRPPQTRAEAPLLTHEDADATAVVSGHGGVAVAERTRQQTGGRRTAPPPRKPVTPWRRVRPVLYIGLGALLLGPFIAFVVGWFIFPVPTSQQVPLPQVARFTFADSKTELATVRPENGNRVPITLDKVPKHVRDAVLSAEDRSFFSNPGFDIVGIGRAVYNQLTGGSGGGSTITQQYVKVSTGQDDFSLWRKYKEVILAVKISREKTKDEILENYLNTIYFGRGAYGIEAAAKAYFGKGVGELSVSEGAMLAGIIQSPSRWDPAKNPERSAERWNFVLDGMVEQGWLDRGERAAQTFPALPNIPEQTGGGVPGDDRYHIYERAIAELEAEGISKDVLDTRGVTVTTTVQPQLQREAVDIMNDQIREQPDNLRYGLVSIDPKTGAIIAYYGGLNGLGMDYAGEASRQPGSSFKPFVLSAALQANFGFGLGTQLDGTGPRAFPGRAGAVRNTEGADCQQCGAVTAINESINTWFYELGLKVGPDNVAEAAHQAGIPEDLLPDPSGGIALGDKEVHPVDMASAYATFAAEGVYRKPYIVSRVETADGEVLYERRKSEDRQAIPKQVARNVIEAMLEVPQKKNLTLGTRQVAAKTGTAQLEGSATENRDAWMVGFTPGVSTAVWVGSDLSDPIRNRQGRPIFGSGLPGQIWHEFMETAVEDTPVEPFSQFVPIGDPPQADLPDVNSDDDEGDDEDSDRDEDSDNDSSRSSDDDGGSSDDDSSSSSRNDDGNNGNDGNNGRPASTNSGTSSSNRSQSGGSAGTDGPDG